jgi:hypothetical protein
MWMESEAVRTAPYPPSGTQTRHTPPVGPPPSPIPKPRKPHARWEKLYTLEVGTLNYTALGWAAYCGGEPAVNEIVCVDTQPPPRTNLPLELGSALPWQPCHTPNRGQAQKSWEMHHCNQQAMLAPHTVLRTMISCSCEWGGRGGGAPTGPRGDAKHVEGRKKQRTAGVFACRFLEQQHPLSQTFPSVRAQPHTAACPRFHAC